MALVRGPVAGAELVLDQPVRRFRVGHPEQRLGKHHKRQAFAGGQAVFAQEILHAPEPAGPGADALNQRAAGLVDAILGIRR